ncbi:MAG: ABC transporter permease [Treponema sp.]|jgi:inositol transport system permease protein|nr:ABC transporter permease [Treponema sp.]
MGDSASKGEKALFQENNVSTIAIRIYRKYGILLILIVMFIISALVSSNFLRPQNLVNILRASASTMILACGMTLLIISGMIDLSGGSTLTLAGCISVGVMASTGNPFLGFSCGIITGAIIGWANGFLITRFSLLPFIGTLAMMNVLKGLINIYTKGSPILGVGSMTWLGQGYIGPAPVPIMIMLICVVIFFCLLSYSKLGLYAYAIGGNSNAALASGININRQKRIIFLVHGIMAGLAGVVMMSRLNSGQPSIGNAGYEFDAIVAAVVGGTSLNGGIGSVVGTLIGVLIVSLINNIMVLLNIPSGYQFVVKGVLIAAAVILDNVTRKVKT